MNKNSEEKSEKEKETKIGALDGIVTVICTFSEVIMACIYFYVVLGVVIGTVILIIMITATTTVMIPILLYLNKKGVLFNKNGEKE